jgi:hypothetical protein
MYTKENLKVNINVNELTDLILHKLDSKQPLSIVRVGDGEIAIMNANPNDKGCKHFYYVHLGRTLEQNKMNEITSNLKNAIINCDILGITDKTSEESDNPYWKISKSVLSDILSKNTVKPKMFCSMGVHYDLVSQKKLDIILSRVDEVYLVTSRDVESKLKEKYNNIKKVHTYKIPGEYVYEDNRKFEDYYPNIYKKIEKDFLEKDMSGKLLLIGGGFVGKNLGVIFSNRGGVSIDLGSIFDNFVGKITRGVGKGPNKYRKPLL